MASVISATVRAELVTAHPLLRWLLPLGFGGLIVLAAIAILLPRGADTIAFEVGRIVFVLAYLALLAVATSRRRRSATVHASASGLYDGRDLIVPRGSIEQIMSWSASGVTTIELRGKVPLVLELASKTDATALLDVLDPDHASAAVSVLATTTPTWVSTLAWIGIPVVSSIPIQALLMAGATRNEIIAVVAPFVLIWLVASWWFIRRRRVTVTSAAIMLPRLFGGTDAIPRSELTEANEVEPYTLELRFARRRPRRMKIYDPPALAALLERLR